MSDTGSKIDEAALAGRFTALTVYHTPEGRWQASMRTNADVTTWRVEVRDTPSAAIEALFSAPGKEPLKPVASGVFD